MLFKAAILKWIIKFQVNGDNNHLQQIYSFM